MSANYLESNTFQSMSLDEILGLSLDANAKAEQEQQLAIVVWDELITEDFPAILDKQELDAIEKLIDGSNPDSQEQMQQLLKEIGDHLAAHHYELEELLELRSLKVKYDLVIEQVDVLQKVVELSINRNPGYQAQLGVLNQIQQAIETDEWNQVPELFITLDQLGKEPHD